MRTLRNSLVPQAHVDELTTYRHHIISGTDQEKVERDTLADRILQLEVDAATPDGEMSVDERSMWLFNRPAVACKNLVNTAEAQGQHTLNKMSELQPLVHGLTLTVGSERALISDLLDGESREFNKSSPRLC